MDTGSNQTFLNLNMTVENERLREIFRNKKFRQAMSLAINREAIIDVLYVGQGEPWQSSPREGSGFYNEQLAKQYTEFDPEGAEALLEEIGLVDKDGDGWREWPDSEDEDFTFTMITRSDKVFMNDTMEMVIPMWHEVGVNAFNKTVEKSFQRQLRNSNDFDAIIDDGDGGWIDIMWDPRTVLPVDNDSCWGEAWYNYLFEPEREGEEPIEYFQVGLDMWREAQTMGDMAEQERIMAEIIQRAADYFIQIGITLPPPGYAIASNNLHNLPDSYLKGWNFCTPGALDMSQWYFEGGARE
jgi:peptide/nickel transport system substrate-binding protein